MKIKKSKGFTLVEILLVVGFIALFAIGLYVIYEKVKSGNMMNSAVKQVFMLKDGIKKSYDDKQSYAGITNTSISNTKSVPVTMVDPSNSTHFISALGGDITVSTISVGTATSNGFRITLSNVGQDECGRFITTAGTDFEQVTVNGVVVKNYSGSAPLNVALANQSCNNSTFSTILLDSISSMKNGNLASGGVGSAIGALAAPTTPAPILPTVEPALIPAP